MRKITARLVPYVLKCYNTLSQLMGHGYGRVKIARKLLQTYSEEGDGMLHRIVTIDVSNPT